ncbi:hypothetical protein HZA85_01225 [Candidatus Uhrbacteria bacterium]|nr:hypothetical protein [Candidatus Uhrbacteria bacterium]
MGKHPWRRVRRGLAQYARQRGIDPVLVGRVLTQLYRLLPLCGYATQSRKAIYRLGCTMLEGPLRVFTPVCPAYSHADGKYTFRGMSDGVPLLFMKHCDFLERVLKVLPDAQITILLADHERALQNLRGVLKVPDDEFERNITGSLAALRAAVPHGWDVRAFTEIFPGFEEMISARAQTLLDDHGTHMQLVLDTGSRAPLYNKIGYPDHPSSIRKWCTAHVAAQYQCFGELMVQRGAVICNHTTTSLRWYASVNAVVLHNQTTVY